MLLGFMRCLSEPSHYIFIVTKAYMSNVFEEYRGGRRRGEGGSLRGVALVCQWLLLGNSRFAQAPPPCL